MEQVSSLVNTLFGKSLTGGYALLFLTFVLLCLAFVIWAIYFATVKKAAVELQNITWLSLKDTLKYTGVTLVSIVIFSSILFVYDFGLDKLVNVIIENAK
jgi:preprotein translocase SecE subunit